MTQCEICFENKTSFKTLHDNHQVCVDCFKRLQTPTCPFCRADIKLYQKPVLMNKYKQNVNINIQRIERRLKRNRRKDFLTYDEYLQHRCKIKQRYKDAHLTKYAQKSPQPPNHRN